MKMEPTQGSETSAIRTKTPGNYPKQNILHIFCGWHHYIDSRKGDSHWVHNSDPTRNPTPTRTRTHTYICLPIPQPVVTPPAPSGHSPSHWLRHFPTTTLSGINTPHVPSQSFIIHLPMKIEPIEGSETSAIRTKTPGNYLKENVLRNFTCLYYVLLRIYVKVSRRDVHKRFWLIMSAVWHGLVKKRTLGTGVIKFIAVTYAFIRIFAYIARRHLRVSWKSM